MRPAALLALVVAATGAHAADAFDPTVGFAAGRNPNGPWEYGFSPSPGTFVASPETAASGRVVFRQPAGGHYPYVAASAARHTVTDPTASWALRPHELALEASADGRPAVVRFVAPRAGRWRVKARFAGIHFRLSSTDVHVVVGGRAVFDAAIDGYGGDPAFHPVVGARPTAVYVATHELAAGEAVAFVVGYGANRTHFDDTTGLRARVTAMATRP